MTNLARRDLTVNTFKDGMSNTVIFAERYAASEDGAGGIGRTCWLGVIPAVQDNPFFASTNGTLASPANVPVSTMSIGAGAHGLDQFWQSQHIRIGTARLSRSLRAKSDHDAVGAPGRDERLVGRRQCRGISPNQPQHMDVCDFSRRRTPNALGLVTRMPRIKETLLACGGLLAVLAMTVGCGGRHNGLPGERTAPRAW